MDRTEQATNVVCDAGPLIHLDELQSIDLLSHFSRVIVPTAVWEEVERHRSSISSRVPPSFEHRAVEISRDPRFRTLVLSLSLDAGEQAALSCRELQEGAVLLTDDSAARLAAKALGFRAHGTLGVLLRAMRRGQRTQSEVVALLRSIPSRSTLHLRHELLAQIIDEAQLF